MAGGQKKGLPSQTKTIHTIDEKHSELIQHYTKIDNETIPQLQKEKDDLKTHIRNLKEGQIDEYMSTKDKIKDWNVVTINDRNKYYEYKIDKRQYRYVTPDLNTKN